MPRWREEDPNAYQSEELHHRPEGAHIGVRLNEAMGQIEQHNSKLAGVLPEATTFAPRSCFPSCANASARSPPT